MSDKTLLTDRQRLAKAIAVLHEQGIEVRHGTWTCCGSCGVDELEQEGFERYAFAHIQGEARAFDDNTDYSGYSDSDFEDPDATLPDPEFGDDLIDNLHFLYSDEQTGYIFERAIRDVGFTTQWNGRIDTTIAVIADGRQRMAD